jgi:hypothetical protein
MKKSFLALALATVCLVSVSVVYSSQYYTAEFLNLGFGVRALGMGSAFAGVSDDSTAAYWNPAGLSQLDKGEFALMYSNMFDGLVKYGFINGVTPKLRIPFTNKVIPGSFGLSIVSLTVPDVPYLPQSADNDALMAGAQSNQAGKLEELYNKQTYDTDAETAIYLSYGLPKGRYFIPSWLLVGINLKSISQKVFSYSSSGIGLDLGFMYTGLMKKGIRIGLNVQDVTGTPIKWSTGATDNIPLSVKFGIGYSVKLPLTTAACFALDIDNKYGSNTNFGTELWFADAIAIRLGYKQLGGPKTTVSNLTGGLGFRFLEHYYFDYAFMGHDELGNSQRASISIKF